MKKNSYQERCLDEEDLQQGKEFAVVLQVPLFQLKRKGIYIGCVTHNTSPGFYWSHETMEWGRTGTTIY